MDQTESVKKVLEMEMGTFHSVVDCVASKMTAQHSSLFSREVEKRLREKVRQEVLMLLFFTTLKTTNTERNTSLTAKGALAQPAKSKLAARGPQKGRRGLESCLFLDFWAF